MQYAQQILKIVLVILGSVLAIPLLIILALLGVVVFLIAFTVLKIKRLFNPGPRWDDDTVDHRYETEAVRPNPAKQRRRPIIIDHE